MSARAGVIVVNVACARSGRHARIIAAIGAVLALVFSAGCGPAPGGAGGADSAPSPSASAGLHVVEKGDTATYERVETSGSRGEFRVTLVDHDTTQTLDDAAADGDSGKDAYHDVDVLPGHMFHVVTLDMQNVGDRPANMRSRAYLMADGHMYPTSDEDADYADNLMRQREAADSIDDVAPGDTGKLIIVVAVSSHVDADAVVLQEQPFRGSGRGLALKF